MFRATVAGALVLMSAVIASPQTAPQKPGPLDNLVPTPNPMTSVTQADAGVTADWRRAMRAKYEGKFPSLAPRTPDGKPDLNGVWVPVGTPERPALTHLGLTLLEDRYKTNIRDFPYSVCLPFGPVPPGDIGPWVVMHNRTQLVTLFEVAPNYRLVPPIPFSGWCWMGADISLSYVRVARPSLAQTAGSRCEAHVTPAPD